MLTVIAAVLGLVILVQGIWRRRQTAITCGAGLLAIVAVDVLMVVVAIRRGHGIPEIPLHDVALLPLALWLAWRGAVALKDAASPP